MLCQKWARALPGFNVDFNNTAMARQVCPREKQRNSNPAHARAGLREGRLDREDAARRVGDGEAELAGPLEVRRRGREDRAELSRIALRALGSS